MRRSSRANSACRASSGRNAGTTTLHDGDEVTVCCAEGAEGHVYAGRSAVRSHAHRRGERAADTNEDDADRGRSQPGVRAVAIPNAGVGLARTEFIVTNHIGIHPMALARYPQLKDAQAVKDDCGAGLGRRRPRDFFVRRFSEGVARIAAAFYPKPVIVRMSDFKTNEYARLLGGGEFEPQEENPMIGFRGASRYYDAAIRGRFCAGVRGSPSRAA